MTSDFGLCTISACGYRLGGPGDWLLPGFRPGDQLRAPWYDETNPMHHFAERASAALKARLGVATPEISELPWEFAAAVEVSPAEWTPETGTPPPLSRLLPATSDLVSADRIAADQYVLVISRSRVDRDERDLGFYEDDGDSAGVPDFPGGDPGLDWDRVLVDALTALEFEPDVLPGWLWYRQPLGG